MRVILVLCLLPRADVFGDVCEVVELRQVLCRRHVSVGFHGGRQFPQTRRRRLHQTLTRTDHTTVLLRPIGVLVSPRLLPLDDIIQDVSERVLGLGQSLRKQSEDTLAFDVSFFCVCFPPLFENM